MSIATELSRIQTDRNTIRSKLVSLGLASSTANLDACATAIDGIANNGAVTATVQEGDTYTIPAGYHNGTGTVSGVAGGGNYSLQSKAITPTKSQQASTPDSGYYGLSDVMVGAIPDNYQDVSSSTVTAADVLANKVFVTSEGKVTSGTMPNIGAVNKIIDAGTKSYTVPKGYHNGLGTVSLTIQDVTVTPSYDPQTIKPTQGKVIYCVSVDPIPEEYVDTTDGTATADDIFLGETAYVGGKKLTGTMPSNGAIAGTIDGLTTTSYAIPAGHTAGGTVSLTSDIEEALAAI